MAAKGWNQRLGGVWPSAKKRAAGCARVSPPILYRRGRKGWRVACTRIIPRPICRRSIHYSADPWPRRNFVDFDRARNSSLSVSFCGSCRFSVVGYRGLAFNEADEGLQKEGTSTFSSSGLEKLVLSRY